MNIFLTSKTKWFATLIAITLVFGFTLLEYFNGGVISHHFLANKNLPKISNWWGLLSIPILAWSLLSIIQKRKAKTQDKKSEPSLNLYGFIGGSLLGIALTILFYQESNLTSYLLLPTFIVALFIPIYKPEYYLGFALSLIYGFGGILPVVIGLFLITIYAIEYCVIRKAFLYVLNKITTRDK
jgi:hypothetical protein